MIKYLTAAQIITIHDEVLKDFGGLAGIRDKNLLLSALEIPKTSFSKNSWKLISKSLKINYAL